MSIPQSHLSDAQKLEAEGKVDLFEIYFVPNGQLYLKNNGTVTWQNRVYEHLPVGLSGVGDNSDEEESKPQMIVANPDGLFSPFVVTGALDRATVVRKRLLRSHLEANQNIFSQRSWYVNRIAELTHTRITLELTNLSEGPNFMVPARMFIPPLFPVVSLG